MRNRLLTGVTFVLVLGLLQGCLGAPKATRTFTRPIDALAPGGAVAVTSYNGRVEVIAGSDATTLTVRLTCAGSSQEDADRRVAESSVSVTTDDARALVVEPVFAGGLRSGDGASIVLHLVRADNVRIETSNGRIRVVGTEGQLDARTSNGSVTVERHRGPADVRTSNGPVRLVELAGAAHVDTSNGLIRVSLVPSQDGPLDLHTSNGSVTTTVGEAFAGRMTMTTSNGAVHIDDPGGRAIRQMHRRDHAEVTLGAGGSDSTIVTSNGSVSLRIR